MSDLGDARLLDSGMQAEIFEWGEGRVLRLVMEGGGDEIAGAAGGGGAMLAREAEVMRTASAGGVPVPAVHELLTVDGRPGMVMDRIDDGPMLSAMLGRPWRLLPLVRRFGEIQAQIHGTPAPEGLVTVHEWSRVQLAKLGAADAGLRAWAERELERLPSGDSLLHGDYHPLNLLMAGGEPQVIDWPAASVGPAEADIARTRVLVEAADPPNGSPVMLTLMGVFRKRLFVPRYLRAYGRMRAFDRELLERWRMVRAIDRLAEAPASEEQALRAMIARSPLVPSVESGTG